MTSKESNLNKVSQKMSKQFDEDEFEEFESKIDSVMKILNEMSGGDKSKSKNEQPEVIDKETFIIKVRDDRTVINKKPRAKKPVEIDQFTFMKQMEKDAQRRAISQFEREEIAAKLRKLGNEAFRNDEYEKAINWYTKAIDNIKDSPILYNNRALSYIRLKLYRLAIVDCDFVLNKLDEKNLRGWLYRATAYYHLNDERNFEKNIKMAKKNNPKEIDYIDKFVDNLKIKQ